MSRYKAGDFVAVINRFDRCGHIVGIDEKGKGYRINTGQDIIYKYEKELVLISSDAPINFSLVSTKLEAASTNEIQSSGVKNNVLAFLQTNTGQAKAFGDWIVKVHKDTLKACLEAVKESEISFPDTVDLYIGINIDFPNSNQNTNLRIDFEFSLSPGEKFLEEEESFWFTQEKIFDLMDEFQNRIQYVCEEGLGEAIKVLFYKREKDILSIYLNGLPEEIADIEQKFQMKSLTQFKDRSILQVRPVTAAEAEKICLIHEIESIKGNHRGGYLSRAYIRGTNLSKANLQEANLSNAYITTTKMIRANLQDANLSESKITWCDFKKADLRNAILSETDLYGNDFRRADLSEADLSGACVRSVDIPLIPMFVVWHSTFRDANLKGANLEKIDFQYINLGKADLRDANLQECNMHKADLTGANLAGADLRGANFENAKVLKAYFGANKGMNDKLKNTLIENGAIFIGS